MAYLAQTKPLTLGDLSAMRLRGEKISMLTCYDASFAALCERAGVDVLRIGDSLGNVLQGHSSTLPVRMEDVLYHTSCVARGCQRPFLIADMPFGSYQESPAQAMGNAARLMAAGAHMVKLEGGLVMVETVRFLVERGVPVCAHIGLTPQSVHQLGGYKIQGRGAADAQRLMEEAQALEAAGASLVVLEMIPQGLGAQLSAGLDRMSTIGIGAGPACHGQVLVLHDMIGVYPGKKARFTKDFMVGAASIEAAVQAYVQAVKAGSFPADEHCY